MRERINLIIARRRWEDNIKLHWREGMGPIDLVQDRKRW
jgi:hypothetical protein